MHWVGFLVAAFTGLATFGGIYTWRKSKDIETWSKVAGRITKRDVISRERLDNNDGRQRSGPTSDGFVIVGGRRQRPLEYAPSIEYAYLVGGREYVGDKINWAGTVYGTQMNARKRLLQVPDEPQVLYDPDNPEDCCLEAPSQQTMLIVAAVGAVCTVAALIYAVV
jgi:hypothetical protein